MVSSQREKWYFFASNNSLIKCRPCYFYIVIIQNSVAIKCASLLSDVKGLSVAMGRCESEVRSCCISLNNSSWSKQRQCLLLVLGCRSTSTQAKSVLFAFCWSDEWKRSSLHFLLAADERNKETTLTRKLPMSLSMLKPGLWWPWFGTGERRWCVRVVFFMRTYC